MSFGCGAYRLFASKTGQELARNHKIANKVASIFEGSGIVPRSDKLSSSDAQGIVAARSLLCTT